MRDTTPTSAVSDLPARTDATSKQLVQRVLGLLNRTIPAPPAKANSELPQFPGVAFVKHGIDLDRDAETNDAAIRASLIYFKHHWPGKVAEIEGPEAFRLKAWAIADEIGLPLKGPRPGSGKVAVHQSD